jgi:hypothetical protein
MCIYGCSGAESIQLCNLLIPVAMRESQWQDHLSCGMVTVLSHVWKSYDCHHRLWNGESAECLQSL